MRIAVDAMGGDHAPAEVVKGALTAAKAYPQHQVLLVGDAEPVGRLLDAAGERPRNLRAVPSSGVIGMEEEPVTALRRKPECSIAVSVGLVRDREADALISAGCTGAAVAAAMMGLNRLPGVRRPGIAAALPTMGHPCVLIDVGANINCRPMHLFQYALMGAAYSELVLDRKDPSVGLLSIGEEDAKGNSLVKETRRLFQREGAFRFVGNVEGRDIFSGKTDVVVCEGFVGNAILKVSEGLAESLFRSFQEELAAAGATPSPNGAAPNGGAEKVIAALRRLKARTDYAEAGGAPLRGLDGICLISHGRSDARAITNAIASAARMAERQVNGRIAEALAARVG